jgi:acyl transferase domain-containing protein/acyl carrier protein
MKQIAVVGMQCRFPGNAQSPDEFFEQLLTADEFSDDIPADRWSNQAFFSNDIAAGKTTCGRGSFLDYEYRDFDPDVFALPADEISSLDPQQRLVLEVAWEALERAGIDPLALSGEPVGVYIGGFTADHLLNQFSAQARSELDRFSAAGSTLTMLANRLSYALDLRGPSLAVDTACASSLTALAAAVGDLRSGACRMALVGGVSFMFRPEYHIAMSAAGLLALDGRSKPFSNLADGYGRGEGCGMIVLKPLDQARADNDRISGVIEGIGTGHGGRTAGISLPNGTAQVDLMRRVLTEAGLDASQIGYVEAHGTGTAQGDRIEAGSIGSVYGRSARHGPLPIGSVKANIGHLEAAAGMAGIIKALLILQSGLVPPQPMVGQPSPGIPFKALNLRLPLSPEPLEIHRIGVNAFGYGGSMAHAIVSLPPLATENERPPKPICDGFLLPLSAQSGEVLSDWLGRLADKIEVGVPLGDLRYTLALRRRHQPVRTAVWVEPGDTPGAIAARIRTASIGKNDAFNRAVDHDARSRTLFVFSGMGPQHLGMGRSLWAAEPTFRKTIEELHSIFQPISGFSLIEAMIRPEADAAWTDTLAIQPLNFAFQVGMVRLLSAYGIDPDICLGHSAGEVAAAYCTGHLSLKQAVEICWARSELQHLRAGRGGMLAAAIGAQEARELCSLVPQLEIAALNAPRSITFAGSTKALKQAETVLASRKSPHRRLSVDIAYHSADMDSILARLAVRLERLEPNQTAIPLISSVTGKTMSGMGHEIMDAAYWSRNVREPVRFQDALETAFNSGATHCIEIGPRPALHRSVAQVANTNAHEIRVIPIQAEGHDEQLAFRKALIRFYKTGGRLDWQRITPTGKVIDLPNRGWRRERFWHETEVQRRDRLRPAESTPWAEQSIMPQVWTTDLNREAFAFLGEHRIEGVAILPGAAALEAALQAALTLTPGMKTTALADIRFENPSPINRKSGQALATRHVGGKLETLIHDPASPLEATCVLKASIGDPQTAQAPSSILELARAAPHPLCLQEHGRRLAARGIDHGPAFQVVKRLSLAADGKSLLAQLKASGAGSATNGASIAPCLVDGMFQAALALSTTCEPYVPVSIRTYRLHAPLPSTAWAWITLQDDTGEGLCFDARFFGSAGHCLAEFENVTVRPLRPRAKASRLPELALALDWQEAFAEVPDSAHRRIAILSSDHDGPLLRSAIEATGADPVTDGNADATVVLVPDGPGPIADRMAAVLAKCTSPAGGRVYIVTRNAQPATFPSSPLAPDQAAFWGLGRTLYNEIAETSATMIDVTPGEAWHETVAREVTANLSSSEIAFRGDRRLVPRLKTISLAGCASETFGLRRSGTYLITGGLGGFGRQLAAWLARHGAGHVVLTSRRRPAPSSIAPLTRELADHGTQLTVEQIERTDERGVRKLVERLTGSQAPLSGIFHWAGTTLDVPAMSMSENDLRAVLEPKAELADLLHRASIALPLDHFVMASSLSALIGNPRQANYAAANAYLDGLAWSRRAAGLPGLSINFGAIAGAGMASDPAVAAHLAAAGLAPMPMSAALAGLGAAMAADLTQVGLSAGIMGEKWIRYDPRCAATDRMQELMAGVLTEPGNDILAKLEQLPSGAQARWLADQLRGLLAQVLKCSAEHIAKDMPVSRAGLDSLAAVEFQLLISRDMGISLPITALIGGQSLSHIAIQIIGRLPCKHPRHE